MEENARHTNGRKRAGTGFIYLGWEWLRDVGERSLYTRADVMAAVFTDDVKLGGPAAQVDEAFEEFDEKIGLSSKSKTVERHAAFVGLEVEWLSWLAPTG